MPTSAHNLADGGRPARILIIDDHEISRAAYRALLRTEGLDVVADVAADGQAVTAARALRPDVAIVDVAPADTTGFGIADELRALPAPPVVILTSSTDRDEFGAGLNGHRFIGKAGISGAAIARLAAPPNRGSSDPRTPPTPSSQRLNCPCRHPSGESPP